MLGDGWAVGHVGPRDRQQYADRPRLLAQLEITLADGSQQTTLTDDSWSISYGPLLDNDMMMGKSYDARLEMPGWDSPGFDDNGWRRWWSSRIPVQRWWRPTAPRLSASKN